MYFSIDIQYFDIFINIKCYIIYYNFKKCLSKIIISEQSYQKLNFDSIQYLSLILTWGRNSTYL